MARLSPEEVNSAVEGLFRSWEENRGVLVSKPLKAEKPVEKHPKNKKPLQKLLGLFQKKQK